MNSGDAATSIQPGDLDVLTMGNGPRVVLVHGSVTEAARTWHKQRALARRFTLILPNRPGFGASPAAARVDFAFDAPLVAALLGDGAHLVGHSYGGIVALFAALARPDAVHSLTVIEPPAFALAAGEPDIAAYVEEMRALFASDTSDVEDFLRRFAALLGVDLSPKPLAPALLQGARLLIGERGPWEAQVPLAQLAAHAIPALVISGDHNSRLERVCDVIAERLGAERAIVAGARHSIPRTGPRLNALLEDFWMRHPPPSSPS